MESVNNGAVLASNTFWTPHCSFYRRWKNNSDTFKFHSIHFVEKFLDQNSNKKNLILLKVELQTPGQPLLLTGIFRVSFPDFVNWVNYCCIEQTVLDFEKLGIDYTFCVQKDNPLGPCFRPSLKTDWSKI